ncbi:MAG: glycosyltransferase [Pleurocapsa sp.]
MIKISVITCTYNPRKDFLNIVLLGLQSQTLSTQEWEFILVDNASKTVLATEGDLSWHPFARHVREEKLGLTHARASGITEAQGEVLVVVDDDNVLDADFLDITAQISRDWSILGAWGGQIRPEFEVEPPEWAKPYLGLLALREFDTDKWSNLVHQHETTPCGAGLCVRKAVAEKYLSLVNQDSKRAALGRKGNILTSCEDSDLAYTACDIGLGTGQFTKLKMVHLISGVRLNLDYFERLLEGMSYSGTILESWRGKLPTKKSWRSRLVQFYIRSRLAENQRRLYDASQRGFNSALKEITSN